MVATISCITSDGTPIRMPRCVSSAAVLNHTSPLAADVHVPGG